MDPEEEVRTGTTLLALKYKDGVLLAADSTTSSGTYIASAITDKLTPITPLIFCCRSGSAADTQRVARIVSREIKLISLKENEKPSVEKAARLAKKIIYENNDNLQAAIIVAGYDDMPRIFKVDVCGSITEKAIALSGSGSAFIYGFVDDNYRTDMELDEAIEFAKTAVCMAIRRDNASGGLVRLAAITESSVSRYVLPGNKISHLRY